MTRPKKPRRIRCRACCPCFKPEGLADNASGELNLLPEELEALKLSDIDGFEQRRGAREMRISQPTFTRILQSARQKVSLALVQGRTIRLDIDGQ